MLRDIWRPDVRLFESGLVRLPRRWSPPSDPDNFRNGGIGGKRLHNTRSDVSRGTKNDNLHLRFLSDRLWINPLSEPELSSEVSLFESCFEGAEELGRLCAVDQPVVVGQRQVHHVADRDDLA
jgi:hypothetical protein